MSSAWGVFLSVAVSAVVGYIFLVALTTHLPGPVDAVPGDAGRHHTCRQSSQYYFGGGVAVIAILSTTTWAQLGDILAAGIAIAMCVLRPVLGRCRRPDALRLQPRRRAPRLGLAQDVSHRYRTPANSLAAIVVVAWLFSVAAGDRRRRHRPSSS